MAYEEEEEPQQQQRNPGQLGGVNAAVEGQMTEAQMNAEREALQQRAGSPYDSVAPDKEFEQPQQEPQSEDPQDQDDGHGHTFAEHKQEEREAAEQRAALAAVEPDAPPAPEEAPSFTGPATPEGWTAETPTTGDGELHLINKKVQNAEKELNLISQEQPKMPDSENVTFQTRITGGGFYDKPTGDTEVFSPEIEKSQNEFNDLVSQKLDKDNNLITPDHIKIEKQDGENVFVINDPEQEKLEQNFDDIVAKFDADSKKWEDNKAELDKLDKELNKIGVENAPPELWQQRKTMVDNLNAEAARLTELADPENKESELNIAWDTFKERETENFGKLQEFQTELSDWQSEVKTAQDGLKVKHDEFALVMAKHQKDLSDWSTKYTNAASRYNVARIGADKNYNMWQKKVDAHNKELDGWNKTVDTWNTWIENRNENIADIITGVHTEGKERAGGLMDSIAGAGEALKGGLRKKQPQQLDDMGNPIIPLEEEVTVTAENVADFGGIAAIRMRIPEFELGDTILQTTVERPPHRTGMHGGRKHEETWIDPNTGLAIDAKKSGLTVDKDGNVTVDQIVLQDPGAKPLPGTVAHDILTGNISPRTQGILDEQEKMLKEAQQAQKEERQKRTLSGSMILDIDRRAAAGEFKGVLGRVKKFGMEFAAHVPTGAESMAAPLWGGESAPDVITAGLGAAFGDRLQWKTPESWGRVGGIDVQLSSKESLEHYKKRGLGAILGGIAGEILIAKPISMALRPVFKVGGAVIRPIAGKAASAAGRVGAMPIPIVKLPVRAAVAPISKVTVQPVRKVVSIAAKPAKIVSAQINKNLGVFIGTLPKKQAARVVSSKAPAKISAGKIIQRPKDFAKIKLMEPAKTRVKTFVDTQKAFKNMLFDTKKKGFEFKGPSFIQQFKGELTAVKSAAPDRIGTGLAESEIRQLEKQFTSSITGEGLGRKGGAMWRSDVGGGFGGGGQVFESVAKTADTPIVKASGQETVQKTAAKTTDDAAQAGRQKGNWEEAWQREQAEAALQESGEDIITTIDGKQIKRKDLKRFGYNPDGTKSYKPADAPDSRPGGITSDTPVRADKKIFLSQDEKLEAALGQPKSAKEKLKTKTKTKIEVKKPIFDDPIVKVKDIDMKQRLQTKKALKKQKAKERFVWQQQQEAKYRQQELLKKEELLKEKERVKLKQKQEAALKEAEKVKKKRVQKEKHLYEQTKEEIGAVGQKQTTQQAIDEVTGLKVGQSPKEAWKLGQQQRQKTGQLMQQEMINKTLLKEMLGTRQITPQIVDQLTKQDQLLSLKQAQEQRQKAIQEARLKEEQRLQEQQRLKVLERLDQSLKQEPVVRQEPRLDVTTKVGLKLRPGLDLVPRLDLGTKLDVGLKTDVSLRTDLTPKEEFVPRLDTVLVPDLDIPTPPKLDTPTYLLPSLTMRPVPDGTLRPRKPRPPFGAPPFLPFGWPDKGADAPKKTLASRSIFAKEIKRDIGVLSIVGKKGIFSDMVGRAKKK